MRMGFKNCDIFIQWNIDKQSKGMSLIYATCINNVDIILRKRSQI